MTLIPTTRNGKILAVAGLVLALGAAGAAAKRAHHWRHGGSHATGGLMGFAGPMGRLCHGNAAEKADHLLVGIEHRIKPTDAQKPAFEELKTAIKTAATKIEAACPAIATEAPATGQTEAKPAAKELPLRLAETETQLAATLDAIKTVRPAADKFYAALSDEQKKLVSEMGSKRHHKHKRWGRDRDDRGDSNDRDDSDDRGRDGAPL